MPHWRFAGCPAEGRGRSTPTLAPPGRGHSPARRSTVPTLAVSGTRLEAQVQRALFSMWSPVRKRAVRPVTAVNSEAPADVNSPELKRADDRGSSLRRRHVVRALHECSPRARHCRPCRAAL